MMRENLVSGLHNVTIWIESIKFVALLSVDAGEILVSLVFGIQSRGEEGLT